MMPRTYVVIAGLCVLAVGAVVFLMVFNRQSTSIDNESQGAASLINSATLESLDKESASLVSRAHLVDGLTPPTNKWYSGVVLNDEPKPGFSIPNSILPSNNGFELGLPSITASSDGIYGPHANGIQVRTEDAVVFKLTRYDELTITLTYYDDADNELFDVTFASGSPYGFIRAKRDVRVTLAGGSAKNGTDGLTTFKNGTAWYGAKTSNGQTGTSLRLQKNDELALFSASKQVGVTALAEAAKYPIYSGNVNYELQGDKVRTVLSYKTKNNGETILIHMPHQVTSSKRQVSTYPSIYGEISSYKSSKIEYTQPRQQLEWSLNLGNTSAEEKATIAAQLKTDIAESKLDKGDTYFGGKQLQRFAQLVMVANSLSESDQRNKALSKLVPALTAWFDSDAAKSFYYDNEAKAVVGREASFGSDKELNDHHFHYGYFVYAASVAAKFNKDFLNKYENDINLLVADIANYKKDEALPLRRNFDAYAGHSWASGIANYGDGNNQESSGEAVNAWTGVGLWADVIGNNALSGEASWLLANEVAASKAYWLKQPKNSTYTSPLVAINWGGKREYKTFFSDEPNAKLAIQLLPLNPTMKPYINALPESIFTGTDNNKQYGDYILMARGDRDIFEIVSGYPEARIDDGNSKTYMMAYVLSK